MGALSQLCVVPSSQMPLNLSQAGGKKKQTDKQTNKTRIYGQYHETSGGGSSTTVFCEGFWERVKLNPEIEGWAGFQVTEGVEEYQARPKLGA